MGDPGFIQVLPLPIVLQVGCQPVAEGLKIFATHPNVLSRTASVLRLSLEIVNRILSKEASAGVTIVLTPSGNEAA